MFRTPWVIAISIVASFGSTVLVAGELHDAVRADDVTALRELLDKGAAIDESDFLLGTALHHAALADNASAAELLIKRGADNRIWVAKLKWNRQD